MNEANRSPAHPPPSTYRPTSSSAPPAPPDRDSQRERQRESLGDLLSSVVKTAQRLDLRGPT